MFENKEVVEQQGSRVGDEQRCRHRHGDGRRCGNRRWAGKKLCYQHDPEAAERRREQGSRVSRLRIMTATEVQELLARTLEGVEAGKVPIGRAYAIGYLGQLLLGNLKAATEEYAAARTSWDRYTEMLWRVRALDEGRYESGAETEEAKDSEVGEQSE